MIRCFDKDIIVVPESNKYMCSRELQSDMYRRGKDVRCFRMKELISYIMHASRDVYFQALTTLFATAAKKAVREGLGTRLHSTQYT